jgi:hypothetical protein
MYGRRLLSMLSCGLAVVSACVAPAFLLASPAGAAPHYVSSDFDGDGVRDLAIGAPGHNRVQIRYTRNPHVALIHPNSTSTIPMGFGQALAVGDFNGDGYSDLAVGAPDFLPPGQTGGFGNPETEGAVFEFYGSAAGLHARTTLRLTGPYDGDEPYNLGQALAAADINGDGRTDLAATLLGIDNGNIEVFRGSSIGLTRTGEQDLNDFEATSLAFGDFNGDHHPDLLAGSPVSLISDAGHIMVFPGRSTGTLRATPQTIQGQQVGVGHQVGNATNFGSDVAAGDVNGDGYGDAVVGATLDTDSTGKRVGSIVVLTGSATGLAASRHQRFTESRIYGTTRNYDLFGAAVAIGKVTSDSYADIMVGAPQVPVSGHSQAGAIYVLRGSAGGASLLNRQRFTQSSAGVPGVAGTHAHFGASLYAAQLVGTANTDLAIGAPDGSDGAAGGGLVVRLRGASGGLTTTSAIIIGDGTINDHLGSAIR